MLATGLGTPKATDRSVEKRSGPTYGRTYGLGLKAKVNLGAEVIQLMSTPKAEPPRAQMGT